MSSPRAVPASVAALVLVVLAGCGGEGSPTVETGQSATTASTTTAPTTVVPVPSEGATTTRAGTVLSVTFRNGTVEGASRQRAPLNQPVTIRVTSDVAEEVHVHGYDKRADVAPGRPAELTFVANIPGVFEVELERAHKLLFTLEVR